MHITINDQKIGSDVIHHLYTDSTTNQMMYKKTATFSNTVLCDDPIDHDRALSAPLQDLLNDNHLHMMPLKAYKNKIATAVSNGIHEHSLAIREILIEELNKNLEHDRVNEILTECGFTPQKQQWIVTIEHNGYEEEIPVKADSEDDAINKINENISSHATITFTYTDPDNGDEFELETEEDEVFLDDLYVTAELRTS